MKTVVYVKSNTLWVMHDCYLVSQDMTLDIGYRPSTCNKTCKISGRGGMLVQDGRLGLDTQAERFNACGPTCNPTTDRTHPNRKAGSPKNKSMMQWQHLKYSHKMPSSTEATTVESTRHAYCRQPESITNKFVTATGTSQPKHQRTR